MRQDIWVSLNIKCDLFLFLILQVIYQFKLWKYFCDFYLVPCQLHLVWYKSCVVNHGSVGFSMSYLYRIYIYGALPSSSHLVDVVLPGQLDDLASIIASNSAGEVEPCGQTLTCFLTSLCQEGPECVHENQYEVHYDLFSLNLNSKEGAFFETNQSIDVFVVFFSLKMWIVFNNTLIMKTTIKIVVKIMKYRMVCAMNMPAFCCVDLLQVFLDSYDLSYCFSCSSFPALLEMWYE